jgi:hypothetical protein
MAAAIAMASGKDVAMADAEDAPALAELPGVSSTDPSTDDLYTTLKQLQRQLEFLDIQARLWRRVLCQQVAEAQSRPLLPMTLCRVVR